jgi:hypothetical protein
MLKTMIFILTIVFFSQRFPFLEVSISTKVVDDNVDDRPLKPKRKLLMKKIRRELNDSEREWQEDFDQNNKKKIGPKVSMSLFGIFAKFCLNCIWL